MKSFLKKSLLAGLTAIVLLGTAVLGYSQTTVVPNPHQPWIGYMNVFGLNTNNNSANYGAYQFGQAWGIFDLRATNDTATATNYLELTPCVNVWNPTNTYWVNANGTPNKWMDASYYVENNNIAGQYITFSGICLSNNLSGNANSVAFIKDFTPNYGAFTPVTVPLVAGQPFSISLQTTAGDHIQYGFETQGPDVNPLYNTNYVVIALDNTNVSLLPLASLSLIQGQKATFAVTNVGSAATSYQWAYSDPSTLTQNTLSDGLQASGSTIFGSATSTLIISNVNLGDIGYYIATVGNSYGSAQESTTLGVQPLSAQIKTNMLIDPGFESGVFALSSSAGWSGFNGAVFQSTNDYYYLTAIPVVVLNGSNCMQIFSTGAGTYNGVFQDRPAQPGNIYTGNAWFYTPSLDQIGGNGQCFLEVQFRDAGNGPLKQYKSANFTASSPVDTWVNMQPTNVYASDLVTFLGTAPYMVAPPGTASVRFQITYLADTGGSVYADVTNLRLRSPSATASVSGNNSVITFPTLYGPIYDVLYKTNLTDATWKVLTSVTGDGTVKSISNPIGAKTRFHTVNTE